MDQNDRRAIEGLFDKLSQVEQQSPPRDDAAERFIAGEITRQPAAPYYMAQTIVVQDHALTEAQGRIAALEAELARARQAAPQPGGLLGRLFGAPPSPPRPAPSAAHAPMPPTLPGQGGRAMPGPQAGQGGGFLAGAAQTAMGVAGGMMLGNALAGMFAGPASAQEADSLEPDAEDQDDSAYEAADFGDDGGDWE